MRLARETESGKGSKLSTINKDKTTGGNNARVSKKKKEFELAKDKILAHFDLTKPQEKAQKGKLMLNLEMARAA